MEPLFCLPHHSIASAKLGGFLELKESTQLIISLNHSTPPPMYYLISFPWLTNIKHVMYFLSNPLTTSTMSSSKGKWILACCAIKSSSWPRTWKSHENYSAIIADNCKQCPTWHQSHQSIQIHLKHNLSISKYVQDFYQDRKLNVRTQMFFQHEFLRKKA